MTSHFLSYIETLSLGSVIQAFKVVSDSCTYCWSQKGENFPELLGFMSNEEKANVKPDL